MASVLALIADAFRPAAPQPSAQPPARLNDAVINHQTGMGLSNDAQVHSRYFHRRLSQWEVEQAYSGSWLMRKLIDKPAKDQVRPRRCWKADKPTIALLEKEEKRLDVWGKHKEAEIERGLGGGAIVMWVKGDDPMTPLDPTRIAKGAISSLSVWKRWHFMLGERIFDLNSEWNGQPSYFEITSLNMITQTFGNTVTQTLRIHPSRVIVYRGEHVANDNWCSWEDKFWGASKVEIALAAVLNADTSQQSFAGMIKDAVNVIIGIPNLTSTYSSLAEIQAYQTARMTAVNAARSIWRAIVKDNGKDGKDGAETVEYRQMVWNGIPQAMMGFVNLVAAAANMPVTELVGTSAQGMNATGEGDRTSWYDELGTRRDTEGRPCLEKLDVALIPSALGKVDDGIWWEYGPFEQPSDLDQATAMWNRAQARQIYINTGALNQLALEQSLANTMIEEGVFVGFDDALDEQPEDEKYPELTAPELDANGNPVDPNALQRGGDPVSQAPGGRVGSAATRRAANDALVKAGLDDAARKIVLDAAFPEDEQRRPFGDAFNPGQPRDPHGRWTSGSSPTSILGLLRRAFAKPGEHFSHQIGVADHRVPHVAGFARRIQSDGVMHALAEHGDRKREAARSPKHYPITRADIARIPAIIAGAHSVTVHGSVKGGRGQSIEHVARIGAHEYHYVERVGAKRQQLTFKTMWKL